ncbi:MAG: type II toxin-antitoxin system VapC family toxin [Tabrizicola sp.]|nr:type II toxin-antitoxin system VapC family toxin [Tabrizicola sp.]
MMVVLDASALASWLMPDEAGVDLMELARQHSDFAAPWLIWAEIRNILIVSERRGRIPAGIADQALEAISDLGIALDTAPSSAAVMDLGRKHGLTAYDALYLELAMRKGAVLTSLDAALRRAASAEGVTVV